MEINRGSTVIVKAQTKGCRCYAHLSAFYLNGLIGFVDKKHYEGNDHEEILVEIQPRWYVWLPKDSVRKLV